MRLRVGIKGIYFSLGLLLPLVSSGQQQLIPLTALDLDTTQELVEHLEVLRRLALEIAQKLGVLPLQSIHAAVDIGHSLTVLLVDLLKLCVEFFLLRFQFAGIVGAHGLYLLDHVRHILFVLDCHQACLLVHILHQHFMRMRHLIRLHVQLSNLFFEISDLIGHLLFHRVLHGRQLSLLVLNLALKGILHFGGFLAQRIHLLNVFICRSRHFSLELELDSLHLQDLLSGVGQVLGQSAVLLGDFINASGGALHLLLQLVQVTLKLSQYLGVAATRTAHATITIQTVIDVIRIIHEYCLLIALAGPQLGETARNTLQIRLHRVDFPVILIHSLLSLSPTICQNLIGGTHLLHDPAELRNFDGHVVHIVVQALTKGATHGGGSFHLHVAVATNRHGYRRTAQRLTTRLVHDVRRCNTAVFPTSTALNGRAVLQVVLQSVHLLAQRCHLFDAIGFLLCQHGHFVRSVLLLLNEHRSLVSILIVLALECVDLLREVRQGVGGRVLQSFQGFPQLHQHRLVMYTLFQQVIRLFLRTIRVLLKAVTVHTEEVDLTDLGAQEDLIAR